MKGILFKPDMIKAIQEGRKTQTRRLIKPFAHGESWLRMKDNITYMMPEHHDALVRLHARCQVGETVYIKEACWYPADFDHSIVYYKSDWEDDKPAEMYNHNGKWLSPLFMPAWAARYFLKIKDVRAERLQEITENDAKLEGISVIDNTPENIYSAPNYPDIHRDIFMDLWDSINKDYQWESNPYVWHYEFSLGESK